VIAKEGLFFNTSFKKWYPRAIKRLGLEYDNQKFGERISIKSGFSHSNTE